MASHNLWFATSIQLYSNQQPYKLSDGLYRVGSEYIKMYETRDPAYTEALAMKALYREPCSKTMLMHATYQAFAYRGYTVMDGSGYCCDYVIYTPGQDHSLACVHVLHSTLTSVQHLVQCVRAAQAVRKVTCFAFCPSCVQPSVQLESAILSDTLAFGDLQAAAEQHIALRTDLTITSIQPADTPNSFDIHTTGGSFVLRLLFIEHISRQSRVDEVEQTTSAIIRVDGDKISLRSAPKNNVAFYKSPDGVFSFGSQAATILPMHNIVPSAIDEDVTYHTMANEYCKIIREINRSTHTFPRCLHTTTCAEPNSFYRWLEQRELDRLTPKTHSQLLREFTVEEALESYDSGAGYTPRPNCVYAGLVEQLKAMVLYKYLCSGSIWAYPTTIRMEFAQYYVGDGVHGYAPQLTEASAQTLLELTKSMVVSEILALDVPRLEIAGFVGEREDLPVHCCAPCCNLVFSTSPKRLFDRDAKPSTRLDELCPLRRHILVHFASLPTWRPFYCIYCIGATLMAISNQKKEVADDSSPTSLCTDTNTNTNLGASELIPGDDGGENQAAAMAEGANSSRSSSNDTQENKRRRGPKSLVYRGDSSKNEANLPLIGMASDYVDLVNAAIATANATTDSTDISAPRIINGQLINTYFSPFYFSSIAEYTLHLQLHGIITHKYHFSRLNEEELLTIWRSGMSLSSRLIPYVCPLCSYTSNDYNSVLEHMHTASTCCYSLNSPECILSQLTMKNYRTNKKKLFIVRKADKGQDQQAANAAESIITPGTSGTKPRNDKDKA